MTLDRDNLNTGICVQDIAGMSSYRHKQRWFLDSEISRDCLKHVRPGDKHTILEIGCYEGLSSVYFADNLLDHAEASLMCVDPFLRLETNDHAHLLQSDEEANFDYNITHCKHSDKITIHKITSDAFFETNERKFNFIYIDGSHECNTVKRDIANAFRCLELRGIMWMDDYLGDDGISIKTAMDTALSNLQGHYELIHKGYQLAVRKLSDSSA